MATDVLGRNYYIGDVTNEQCQRIIVREVSTAGIPDGIRKTRCACNAKYVMTMSDGFKVMLCEHHFVVESQYQDDWYDTDYINVLPALYSGTEEWGFGRPGT